MEIGFMRKYNHKIGAFKESEGEGERPVFRVAFTLEKDFYIEAESEEALAEQLDNIDYSSVEEAVWVDGAYNIKADIVGDTSRSSEFSLEPTEWDTYKLERC